MSLRTRLLILVIVAMLVPAVLVGLRFVQNRASDINTALINLSATADDISNDLDEKIQGTAQLHYGLARARDLDTRDKAACSAFLSAVREEYPQFTGILTINPDGSLFCNSLQDQPQPRPAGSRLFQAGPGRERRRDAAGGVRPADGDIGAADRVSRALGKRGAEIRPARLAQSAEIRGDTNRRAKAWAAERSCSSTRRARSLLPPAKYRTDTRRAPRSQTPSCSDLRPHLTASPSAS